MGKRLIYRHKNCGGFILPDIENSFIGMNYCYCPKCGKQKLIMDDLDSSEEDITLYTIRNKETGEFLIAKNDYDEFTILFESEEQANDFANMHSITDYEIESNVALYCDELPVLNGRMIIDKGDE